LGLSVVPEPSTYALLAGFAAFIFVAIRRRNS
ncbi:MAG: PEP-CTERM sorting domain-containing protein, partial [Coraliomargaritaceae bacterium]